MDNHALELFTAALAAQNDPWAEVTANVLSALDNNTLVIDRLMVALEESTELNRELQRQLQQQGLPPHHNYSTVSSPNYGSPWNPTEVDDSAAPELPAAAHEDDSRPSSPIRSPSPHSSDVPPSLVDDSPPSSLSFSLPVPVFTVSSLSFSPVPVEDITPIASPDMDVILTFFDSSPCRVPTPPMDFSTTPANRDLINPRVHPRLPCQQKLENVLKIN